MKIKKLKNLRTNYYKNNYKLYIKKKFNKKKYTMESCYSHKGTKNELITKKIEIYYVRHG